MRNKINSFIRHEKTRIWAEAVVGGIILLFVFYWTIPFINSPFVQREVNSLGVFGPLIIIFYFVVSDVISPLAGSPGIVLSTKLYGIWPGLFLSYMSGLISAAINFYLSQRYGRSLIVRFIGKKNLEKVDCYVEKFGFRTLIIGRLFGFVIFEVISYAAGLTKMNFKKYFIITLVVSAIPSFTVKYLLAFSNMNSPTSLLFWTGIISCIGIFFTFVVERLFLKMSLVKDCKVTKEN